MCEAEKRSSAVWMYWEDVPGRGKRPEFIDLCIETIRRNCGLLVRLLDAESVSKLIDCHPNWKELREPAHKADYVRCVILHKFGGIWLDCDMICLNSLIPLSEMLADYDFVGFDQPRYPDKESWDDYRTAIIAAFAARPKSKFLQVWIEKMHETLDRAKDGVLKWEEIGSKIVRDVKVIMEEQEVPYFFFKSEYSVAPFQWSDKTSFWNDQTCVQDVLECKINPCPEKDLQFKSPLFFIVLYNKVFPREAKKLSRKAILDSKMLFGALIREALGIPHDRIPGDGIKDLFVLRSSLGKRSDRKTSAHSSGQSKFSKFGMK